MGDADSHYVNEKEIGTELLKVQNTPPTIPNKSFYTLIISILVPNTETPLISQKKQLPITTKLTNLSPDHQTISQNFFNITHASTN